MQTKYLHDHPMIKWTNEDTGPTNVRIWHREPWSEGDWQEDLLYLYHTHNRTGLPASTQLTKRVYTHNQDMAITVTWQPDANHNIDLIQAAGTNMATLLTCSCGWTDRIGSSEWHHWGWEGGPDLALWIHSNS